MIKDELERLYAKWYKLYRQTLPQGDVETSIKLYERELINVAWREYQVALNEWSKYIMAVKASKGLHHE